MGARNARRIVGLRLRTGRHRVCDDPSNPVRMARVVRAGIVSAGFDNSVAPHTPGKPPIRTSASYSDSDPAAQPSGAFARVAQQLLDQAAFSFRGRFRGLDGWGSSWFFRAEVPAGGA